MGLSWIIVNKIIWLSALCLSSLSAFFSEKIALSMMYRSLRALVLDSLIKWLLYV